VEQASYSFASVAKILAVTESKLRYWSQVGFVGPSLRKGTKQLFSFQDLISVKAAKELSDRGVTAARIRKALDKVRDALPHLDRPLDHLRVAFDGETLLVIDGAGAFDLRGQKVFDFSLQDLAREASSAPGAAPWPALVKTAPAGDSPPPPAAGDDAGAATGDATEAAARAEATLTALPGGRGPYEWFIEGLRLEADPARIEDCERAYRQALALDEGLAAVHTNLGRLLHRRGDTQGARACFEAALALDPEQPEARFNLANLILEAGDFELAVAELRRVLQSAPDFADAHYNLAVALERLGGRAQARAHLERYLGLDSSHGQQPVGARAAEARLLVARVSGAFDEAESTAGAVGDPRLDARAD
jgi:tetratricopeptide (TPR) repeat protein